MGRFFLLLLTVVQTLIAPESSLASWLYGWDLSKVDTFYIVVTVGNVPLIFLFWPKCFNIFGWIVPVKIREKICYGYEMFLARAKKINGVFYATINLDNPIATSYKAIEFILLFVKVISEILLDLIQVIIAIIAKLKAWLNSFEVRTKKRMKKFGYFSVVIGAIAPFPLSFGVRQAGMASVLLLKTNQAKILFILCDIVRFAFEIYLLP